MSLLTRDFSTLLVDAKPPCLSLYQPTHRNHPANRQDPIRFRNLVKELERSLEARYAADDIAQVMAPLHALADDPDFWQQTLDGLAVFAAPGVFRHFETQRPLAELAVVADSFHTKPLWRLLQSLERYQVLCISRQAVRLYEGTRDALDEVPLATGVPRTAVDAIGEEQSEPHHTVASYGGTGAGTGAMHHGHGEKSDEVDQDTERFFRAVDRAVLEHHSRTSGLSLVLAALPEHHALFHKVSRNPQLLDAGITANPDAIPHDELRERAWQCFEPAYREQLTALGDSFAGARARGLGSDDLAQVAAAASAGRVETLLIESERQIPGRIDAATGQVQLADMDDPTVDDLLDDLGEIISRMGGKVMVLPRDLMPGETGVAATYRF
jgi:hypothetical protein